MRKDLLGYFKTFYCNILFNVCFQIRKFLSLYCTIVFVVYNYTILHNLLTVVIKG